MTSMKVRWKRLFLAFPLVIALLLTSTFSVSARPLYYGDAVPAGTVVQADVFLIGNNVVIDGTVAGDVLALGNNIRINGTIEGSLVAIAQTIRITGDIKGTAYTTGIAIELGSGATLDRNLYYGGLSFAMRKESLVNRDLSAFSLGGTMIGQINGNVKAVIGPYEILKLIFDAFKVNVQLPGMIYDEPELPEATPESLPPAQPTLQPTSSIISPSSLLPGHRLTALQVGTPDPITQALIPTKNILINPTTAPTKAIGPATTPSVMQPANSSDSVIDWQQVGNWFLGRLRSLLVLLTFCLLAYWVIPGNITRASGMLIRKPLHSLGTGLIGSLISFNAILAAILVAAIFTAFGFWLVFATVWELGIFVWATGLSLVVLFIILVCLLVFYVTKAIVAYTLTFLILKKVPLKKTWMKFLALLLGLIIYVLLAGLPYAGWVIGILATAFGFGSAWLDYREKREQQKHQNLPPSTEGKKSPVTKPGRKVVRKVRPKIKMV